MNITATNLVLFNECPHKFKLSVIDKKSKFKDNIYTVFGKIMHDFIQNGVKNKEFDEKYDIKDDFFNRLEKANCEKDKYQELVEDSKNIINGISLIPRYFIDYNEAHIEKKLLSEINSKYNFSGRMDLLIKLNEEKYAIIDIKTSKVSWNYSKINDPFVNCQLLLYKYFFIVTHNINPRNVSTSYMFLNKKSKRNPIDIIRVSSGPTRIKECILILMNTINFINRNKFYKSYNKNVCRWCEFNATDDCPGDKNDM